MSYTSNDDAKGKDVLRWNDASEGETNQRACPVVGKAKHATTRVLRNTLASFHIAPYKCPIFEAYNNSTRQQIWRIEVMM